MNVGRVLGSLSRMQVKLTSPNHSCGAKLPLSPRGLCVDAGRGYVGMAVRASTECALIINKG